jgi:Ser/Thr protein kinase RdoA (MazF antagonist)
VGPGVIGLAARFATVGEPVSAERFGGGHVNDTFRVIDNSGRSYLLQRISRRAFKRPREVMENIVAVTAHLAAKSQHPRDHLTLVPARDGAWWVEDDQGDVWRLYDFIAGSMELPLPASPADFKLAGEAFGRFLLALSDLDAAGLHTTIEHYHDEPRWIERLKAVMAADPVGRLASVAAEAARVLAYEPDSHALDDPAGQPLRVTHNDAKLANVLFDTATRTPLCIVDLDTIQPGLAVNDFGDSIRSGACTAGEEEPDWRLVAFSPERFAAYAEGYLSQAGPVLTPAEIAALPTGARLMTLETSVRFLTDHIEGDVYYRIEREGQNLDRARNQLALLDDLTRHEAWMREVIADLA